MKTEFRLDGKHVLAMLIAFFVVILIANIVFISFAVKTFPGEREEKSYLQGINYGKRLAARAAQASRGWTAKIEEASRFNGQVKIRVSIDERNGAPISGLRISGMLSRPTNATQDHALIFTAMGAGVYQAVAPADAGVWELQAKAVNKRDEEFEFSNRLVLE